MRKNQDFPHEYCYFSRRFAPECFSLLISTLIVDFRALRARKSDPPSSPPQISSIDLQNLKISSIDLQNLSAFRQRKKNYTLANPQERYGGGAFSQPEIIRK